MHKYISTIAFLLVFAVSLVGWPLSASATDDVTFATDTIITVNSISFEVMANSKVDQMVVNATNLVFTMSANSVLEIRSGNRYIFTSSAANTDCSNGSYSKLVLPAYSTATEVGVTPSTDICPSASSGGGGGGGGGAALVTTAVPSTTNGQVTATAGEGGKTTLTTAENATAQVEIPASTVSASTNVKIATEAKSTVIASKPVPSGKNIVGGYVYNYTAVSGTTLVTTFSKNLTLTFTYTDSQIAGLNEDTLKIYYWNGSQWTALTSTVDKTKNQITAPTNHFTYFVIMGEAGVTPTTMAKPEDYGLKEGNLIRAVGDIDIFIINQYGYKRLFLNPAIFNMYGHLGGWSAVKSVAPSTRDAFVTSNYYRYVDSPKVYFVEVTGGDTGIFHWVNMTAENFLAQGGKANAIFTINKSEFDWYPKGTDKTSL